MLKSRILIGLGYALKSILLSFPQRKWGRRESKSEEREIDERGEREIEGRGAGEREANQFDI